MLLLLWMARVEGGEVNTRVACGEELMQVVSVGAVVGRTLGGTAAGVITLVLLRDGWLTVGGGDLASTSSMGPVLVANLT